MNAPLVAGIFTAPSENLMIVIRCALYAEIYIFLLPHIYRVTAIRKTGNVVGIKCRYGTDSVLNVPFTVVPLVYY
jgi:hypothetical protein